MTPHERLMDRLNEVMDRKERLVRVRSQFMELIRETKNVKELQVIAAYLALKTNIADWAEFEHWIEEEEQPY